eukprot:TRINITY_DN2548_c0_g1_i3.p3 TRINITY_DN2548_c0_g1~~TRINITY_DN2548_c0_g1_i3.p3  ORF type:complete len:114 (-),score=22.33 TRINITY_DN2548_c0_g1_i3:313-654(-)
MAATLKAAACAVRGPALRGASTRSAIAVVIGLPCAFVAIPQIRRVSDMNEYASGEAPVLAGDMTARYSGMVERMSVGSGALTQASEQMMNRMMKTNSVMQSVDDATLRKTRSE